MNKITWEDRDGGVYVDKQDIQEIEYEAGIKVYTGEAVRKLSEYENIEQRIKQIHGIDVSLKQFIDIWFEVVEAKTKEKVIKTRILTNEDADLYDEFKKQQGGV